MNLRPYQIEAKDAVLADFANGVKSTLLLMPTGCGKTEVALAIIEERLKLGRALFLAHTRDLIFQTRNRCRRRLGIDPAIEMGEYRQSYSDSPIVIASVQTFSNCVSGGRSHGYDPNDFAVMAIDEAHRSARQNVMYRACQDWATFPYFGQTATGDRTDKRCLFGAGKSYEKVAFEYSLLDAIRDGYLVDVHHQHIEVKSLDFSAFRMSAGDFTGKSIEQVMAQEEILHKVIVPTLEIVGQQKAVFFCSTIAHAHAKTDALNRYRPGSAVLVHGKQRYQDINGDWHTLDKGERKRRMDAYANGDVQFMVSVDALIEGWDDPPTANVIICRPTKSRCRFAQMVGRGTRPLPECVNGIESVEERRQRIAESDKPSCRVLDFYGTTADLKLVVTIEDILANADESFVAEVARKIAEKKAKKAAESISEAQELLDLQAELMREEADRLKDKLIASGANWTARELNPFDYYDRKYVPKSKPSRVPGEGATPRVAALLYALGYSPEAIRSFGKSQAQAIFAGEKEKGSPIDWRKWREWPSLGY